MDTARQDIGNAAAHDLDSVDLYDAYTAAFGVLNAQILDPDAIAANGD
jgi:hypothetical protein